jgi:GT2 family glycosyltransferase
MNNDYIIKNSFFLRYILKYMKSRNDIAIAQGVNLQSDGKRIESVGKIINVTMQTIARCEGLELSECPEKPSYVTYAMGNLVVIKLKPVMKIRGYLFKEELFLLWEETELALDMWSHGFKKDDSYSRDRGDTHGLCYCEEGYASRMVCCEEK